MITQETIGNNSVLNTVQQWKIKIFSSKKSYILTLSKRKHTTLMLLTI